MEDAVRIAVLVSVLIGTWAAFFYWMRIMDRLRDRTAEYLKRKLAEWERNPRGGA